MTIYYSFFTRNIQLQKIQIKKFGLSGDKTMCVHPVIYESIDEYLVKVTASKTKRRTFTRH